MRYVIVGNSTAAIGCIEGIRKIDRHGEIVVISDESHHTYSRPLISYFLLGKTDMGKLKYRRDSFYEDNKCTTMFGIAVTKILPDKKEIVLDNGKKVPYDKLLVATGSRPFIPPFGGLEKVKRKFTFMSLDDAVSIKKSVTPGSRVLIIGAGLIGLKCAEGILEKVASVTVVDLAKQILPSILDKDSSAIVQNHLMKLGIRFILGDSIDTLDENLATLKSGKTLSFDILVIAVGVRPNTALLAGAGGKVSKGILTNTRCETDIKDIYAAGDCCESYDISCGMYRPLAVLPNAYMQGECAGGNMAGKYTSIENAIPMNALGFFGLRIITAGTYEGNTYIQNNMGNYKALFYKDDLLKGYILIGDVARAGIYTSLIRNQTPLDTIDFELICEKPQLMAFTRNTRAELLGKER